MVPEYAGDQPGAMPADESASATSLLELGRTFFVDPDEGVDASGRGVSVYSPAATIQWAHDNLCLSGRGDVIRCRPGTYAENLVLTKGYVRVVGMIPGYGKPDVVPAAGIALVIRAQGVRIESIRFASDDVNSDVVRIEGNGWGLKDVVIDGSATMANTRALLRLWCHVSDDAFTASEGLAEDVLLRGNGNLGRALVFDVQHALVGVGSTHNRFYRLRFMGNTLEDVFAAETAAGTYSAQNNLFVDCTFEDRNKATMVDLDTNNGATNTGNLFAGCFFWDDTFDGTTFKGATSDTGLVGCTSLDGVINGDALD